MKPVRRLKRLVLDRIDIVGAPACPEAWISLMKSKTVPVAKLDSDKRRVWGWASVALDRSGGELVDAHADVVDPAGLEEAAVVFMLDHRASGANHTGGQIGRVFEALYMSQEKATAMGLPPGPVPTGLWIGVQIDDEDTWQQVKAGRLPGFSVQGRAESEPVEKADPRAAHFAQAMAALRQPDETPGDHQARLQREQAARFEITRDRLRAAKANGEHHEA